MQRRPLAQDVPAPTAARKQCTVDGCTNEAAKRTPLCKTHYNMQCDYYLAQREKKWQEALIKKAEVRYSSNYARPPPAKVADPLTPARPACTCTPQTQARARAAARQLEEGTSFGQLEVVGESGGEIS